jgi:hypothetical protein
MREDALFMAPKKRTVYVNLYKPEMKVQCAYHSTKDAALEASSMWHDELIARAVPVEIEE